MMIIIARACVKVRQFCHNRACSQISTLACNMITFCTRFSLLGAKLSLYRSIVTCV